MVLDATTLVVPRLTAPVTMPAWPSPRERQALLDELNLALRDPDAHGGPAAIGCLMDRLAASEPPRADGRVWLPDTLARLSTAELMRRGFSDPQVQVVASQYAEDAHRRGWLRPDRTLTPGEHGALLACAQDWAQEDRTLPELLERFGEPSVVHGCPEPDRSKSLTYVCADHDAPVITFHLAAGAPAIVLAVRTDEDIFDGWALTPHGEAVFTDG